MSSLDVQSNPRSSIGSVSSFGSTAFSQDSDTKSTISDPDIITLVDEFGINFIAIIQKLESMIRDAKNKDSNLTTGNVRSIPSAFTSRSSSQSTSSDGSASSGSTSSQGNTGSQNPKKSIMIIW